MAADFSTIYVKIGWILAIPSKQSHYFSDIKMSCSWHHVIPLELKCYKCTKKIILDGFVASIEAERDYLISHNIGAYEVDANTIIFDALTYNNAEAYTQYAFIKEIIHGGVQKNANNLTRFTIHLDGEPHVEMDLLHPQPEYTALEFPQMNEKYKEQKYR